MGKSEMDSIIAGRPKAFAWLGFQRSLLWLFLALGIVFMINTSCIVVSGMIKYFFIDEASKKIAAEFQINQFKVQDILLKYLNPLNYEVILYNFFLSISFFITARYCKKIMNRNKYILQLENEWYRFTGKIIP